MDRGAKADAKSIVDFFLRARPKCSPIHRPERDDPSRKAATVAHTSCRLCFILHFAWSMMIHLSLSLYLDLSISLSTQCSSLILSGFSYYWVIEPPPHFFFLSLAEIRKRNKMDAMHFCSQKEEKIEKKTLMRILPL